MTELNNKGIVIFNKSEFKNLPKTIVVMGVARSGTSMAAHCLHKLGVNMGAKKNDVIFERNDVFNKLESNNVDGFRKFVELQNNKFKLWGWKRPKAVEYVGLFENEIRNPHFIIPIRDFLAIATRNNMAVNVDIKQNLINTYLHEYKKVIDFLKSTKHPLLLFSYEKALIDPEYFVEKLSQFVGIKNLKRKQRAVGVIQANNQSYIKRNFALPHSKLYIGRLDRIKDNKLLGWAKLPGEPKPVELRLYINNNFIKKIDANILRSDLEKLGYGKCSFNIDLDQFDLKKGKKYIFSVFLPDGNQLNNSPIKNFY